MITRVDYQFSVEDYEQMIDHGILTENDRVELIRGRILEKMPIGDRHAGCVNRITRYLIGLLSEAAVVAIQNPVVLLDSEPEPDVAILKPRDDFYASSKPHASDVLLLIEVADTGLEFDREEKRSLYAESGIHEYWIVNLIDDDLEVFRSPSANHTYSSLQTLKRGDEVDVVQLPGVTVSVDEILGPALDD